MVSVGTIIWLSSELMFFAALFAMYFTVRSEAPFNWPPKEGVGPGHVGPVDLHTYYALVFTTILVSPASPASWGCSPPSAATSIGYGCGFSSRSSWAPRSSVAR
jgi:cytochrome c oxidase subunit 3